MMRNDGEVLRESIAGLADAAAERNEPIWAVTLDAFCQRLFCDRGQMVAVLAVMVANRYGWRIADTDREGVTCVMPNPPRERFAIAESFMPCFVAALRANGVHGTYRESGTERSYRF